MLSTKNLSPRQLAAYTAGILSIPIAIGIAVLTMNWKIGVVSLGVVFAGSYSLIILTLERFIYRKIKLIYKLIYQTKATKKEEVYFKYILPQKSIDEVREDVEEWGERRNREIESLRQNEAFRKEFLQNLSHEFKTPIFAIQSFVETLLDGAADDEKVRTKFLQNTSKNVDRLVNLVNDLDEISRLESGAQLLYKQNFIIQDLIRETYDSLSIKTQAKQIKTSIKKGCEAPVTVFADKEKIKQVLTNLVENACKYGKNGERFYRTDTARSRDKGGTGLGLAICKHIIEAHGQSIHVRSTPDVGTTIGFTLEAKREV